MKTKFKVALIMILTLILIGIMVLAESNEGRSSNINQSNKVNCAYTFYEPRTFTLEEYIKENEEFTVEKIEECTDGHLKDYSLQHLLDLILDCEKIQELAHEAANAARQLNWPEECETIQNAQAEWHNAEVNKKAYKEQYNELSEQYKNISLVSQYPSATYVWLYLKDLGYNDYVCAGIMGNIMAETGGNTLDINPGLYSKSGNYYGICQWSISYKEVWNCDLETQCDFLKNTIQYEFDTFGYKYKTDFNYY